MGLFKSISSLFTPTPPRKASRVPHSPPLTPTDKHENLYGTSSKTAIESTYPTPHDSTPEMPAPRGSDEAGMSATGLSKQQALSQTVMPGHMDDFVRAQESMSSSDERDPLYGIPGTKRAHSDDAPPSHGKKVKFLSLIHI